MTRTSGALRVIVLGVDTPIGLTVVRELGAAGCHVHGIGAAQSIGGASRHCHGLTVRPGTAALMDWLPDVIHAVGADALLAISEGDLLALATIPPVIGNCRILTPRAATLGAVLDKTQTYAAARRVGIDVPDSWQPVIGDALVQSADVPGFPVVAKWAAPNAVQPLLAAHGLSFVKAEHIADATQLGLMLERYRPLGQWPVVQSYCPGVGIGQMLHMHDGRATLRFQHQRLHEWPPTGGVSTSCVALSPGLYGEQIARSEALLAAIDWEGPAMVEYRYDPATGRFWLMEVNGRFWGSLPLTSAAGYAFAREHLSCAFPGRMSANAPEKRRAKARFMIPETRRLLTILRHGGAEGRWRALASYVGGFFDPHMHYYVWRWSDPAPFFRDMRNVIISLLRRSAPEGTAAPDA